jgi:AcrR family transcriptional regulator
MLNMSSAEAAAPARDARDAPDRTARSRIRDAAIRRFAAEGVAATSVRAIAEEAGVSAPLVIHHFGSKDGLRVACDEHVAALVRDRKTPAMAAGTGLDPIAALREQGSGPPVLLYLARTLLDGSPHVADLVDEMVADAVAYMEAGVAAGALRPTADPHGRAAVLTLWSLGALVLHEHASRLLGAELTASDPQRLMPYLAPGLELLGEGVLTTEMYARLRDAFPTPTAGPPAGTQEPEE